MSHNSKNLTATAGIFSLQVDRTFLEARAKNLVKVARNWGSYEQMEAIYLKRTFFFHVPLLN